MEIFEHRYRLGLSQILLRNDVLVELEERRDLSLSGLVVSLQRQCRMYLASREILDSISNCENGLVEFVHRVMPLLSVVRSDSEQREWRDRVASLEAANSELKSSKLRLEGQIGELEQLLKAECQGTQNLSVSLERESTNKCNWKQN
uniref:Uncharacterized protein n=1 Tax=Ditylenchus dipsaci TaxID=166011 RepID=A0A915E7I2_9BILA